MEFTRRLPDEDRARRLRCASLGICESIAPELFEVGLDGALRCSTDAARRSADTGRAGGCRVPDRGPEYPGLTFRKRTRPGGDGTCRQHRNNATRHRSARSSLLGAVAVDAHRVAGRPNPE